MSYSNAMKRYEHRSRQGFATWMKKKLLQWTKKAFSIWSLANRHDVYSRFLQERADRSAKLQVSCNWHFVEKKIVLETAKDLYLVTEKLVPSPSSFHGCRKKESASPGNCPGQSHFNFPFYGPGNALDAAVGTRQSRAISLCFASNKTTAITKRMEPEYSWLRKVQWIQKLHQVQGTNRTLQINRRPMSGNSFFSIASITLRDHTEQHLFFLCPADIQTIARISHIWRKRILLLCCTKNIEDSSNGKFISGLGISLSHLLLLGANLEALKKSRLRKNG